MVALRFIATVALSLSAFAFPTRDKLLNRRENNKEPEWARGSSDGTCAVAESVSAPEGFKGEWPPFECDPKAKGPYLEKWQQAAFADYVNLLLVEGEVRLAFMRWTTPDFIEHDAIMPPTRDEALEVLVGDMFNPNNKVENITYFSGEGYGMIHFKYTAETETINGTFAIIDYFLFKGTCIIEHWDSIQQIHGNEPNPVAFF